MVSQHILLTSEMYLPIPINGNALKNPANNQIVKITKFT